MIRECLIRPLIFFGALAALAQEPDFSYQRRPLDVQLKKTESKGEIKVRDLTFAGVDGKPIGAFFILPPGKDRVSATLYVHWYASQEPDSNRHEFFDEALDMARRGQASLLIETMWSDPAWYPKRIQADDYKNSVTQVKNLRRALDVLVAEPRIDPDHIALVGHDFGGMCGTIAAAVDKRIKALVVMAAANSFNDWYMYGKFRLEGEAKDKFVSQMAPLDPIKHLEKVSIPVLMQFAEFDFYVPREKVAAFRKALPKPNSLYLYDAGHGLDWQAARDRKAFLIERFKLRKELPDIIHSYLTARSSGDAAAIEAFYAPDFREIYLDQPVRTSAEARRNYYDFEQATHGHFEYRLGEITKDSVTADVFESSYLLEALGTGVRRVRTTYRVRDGKISEMRVTSILDARRPLAGQRKAFVEWVERERPSEAKKVLDKGHLRMDATTAEPMLTLVREWSKLSDTGSTGRP